MQRIIYQKSIRWSAQTNSSMIGQGKMDEFIRPPSPSPWEAMGSSTTQIWRVLQRERANVAFSSVCVSFYLHKHVKTQEEHRGTVKIQRLLCTSSVENALNLCYWLAGLQNRHKVADFMHACIFCMQLNTSHAQLKLLLLIKGCVVCDESHTLYPRCKVFACKIFCLHCVSVKILFHTTRPLWTVTI